MIAKVLPLVGLALVLQGSTLDDGIATGSGIKISLTADDLSQTDCKQCYSINITPEDTAHSYRVQRRYREFDALRESLGHEAKTLPRTPFPPKEGVLGYFGFKPLDVELRRRQLEDWLQNIVLHPESIGRWADALGNFLNVVHAKSMHSISMPRNLYFDRHFTERYFGIVVKKTHEETVQVWRSYNDFVSFKKKLVPGAKLKAKFPSKIQILQRRFALEVWLREVQQHPMAWYAGPWKQPLLDFLNPSTPLSKIKRRRDEL